MTTPTGRRAAVRWRLASEAPTISSAQADLCREAATVAENELAPDEYIEQALTGGPKGVASLLLAWADVLADCDDADDDAEDLSESARIRAVVSAAGYEMIDGKVGRTPRSLAWEHFESVLALGAVPANEDP